MSNFGLIQLIKRNCAPMTHTKFDNGIRFFYFRFTNCINVIQLVKFTPRYLNSDILSQSFEGCLTCVYYALDNTLEFTSVIIRVMLFHATSI